MPPYESKGVIKHLETGIQTSNAPGQESSLNSEQVQDLLGSPQSMYGRMNYAYDLHGD